MSVDPVVFAAAARTDARGHAAAREVITAVQIGALRLALPVTAVTAVVRLLLREGRSPSFALARGRDLTAMAELLDVSPDDAHLALDLFDRYPEAGGRVAAIAATLRRHQVAEIVADDPRFDAMPGLVRIPPERVLGL